MNLNEKLNIFKKLSQKEKLKIFNLFEKIPSEIVFKFEGSRVYKTRLIHHDTGIFFICKRISLFSSFFASHEATISFTIQNEKFFFKGKVHERKDKLWMELSGDLFLLQRRKTKRLFIPSSYSNTIRILSINGRKTFLDGRVIDFSHKGSQVELPQQIPQLKSGNQLMVSLRIGHRKGIEFEAIVRHHKNVTRNSMGSQIFGLEFANLDILKEERLQTIFDDIYRELFSKMNTGVKL